MNKIMDILVGGPELRINARSPVRSRTAQEGKARPGRGDTGNTGGGRRGGPLQLYFGPQCTSAKMTTGGKSFLLYIISPWCISFVC